MTPINILIVDDREENIIALEALLKRNDIHIFSTTSPNEALKIAWENNIAIALVDVQMPEIDGFELVDMLKSNPRTKDILIIFVTAISKESKYAVKGYGTGAVDYLYKPLDPYITSAKVDSFVQLARTRFEIVSKNQELENFALVVSNSADIICAIDAHNFRIQTINPAAERILGYKQSELIGKSIINNAIETDRTAFRNKLVDIVADNIDSSVFDFQFEKFDKQVIWVECRSSYSNKTVFLNISDISAQKSHLQELVRLKETAEYGKKIKENFLANMSHELRTPVNGIIGLTQLMLKTPLDDQQKSMLELLETSSQSLLGVINDVLDISKIEAGKYSIIRKPGNIRQIVGDIYKLLKFKADEKLIDLLLDVEPGIPEYLDIDSLRLNQILMNLLSNAIKFTDRGQVKLKVSVLQKSDAKVHLKFSVEDTGIGIAANKLTKIFESFEQADDDTASKYGGTGLGLAIVKKLAELKGGELTFSSRQGQGSVFNFTNWYTVSEAPDPPVKSRNDGKILEPFKNIRVLVAEDNLVNQLILSKLLNDWEAEVDVVDNGLKAIDKLRNTDYDLILMDTYMPEMNGFHAAKLIRADFSEPKRSIPIISLSAAALEHEKEGAISAGMNDVLTKPFQPYQLHDKIKNLLNVPSTL